MVSLDEKAFRKGVEDMLTLRPLRLLLKHFFGAC